MSSDAEPMAWALACALLPAASPGAHKHASDAWRMVRRKPRRLRATWMLQLEAFCQVRLTRAGPRVTGAACLPAWVAASRQQPNAVTAGAKVTCFRAGLGRMQERARPTLAGAAFAGRVGQAQHPRPRLPSTSSPLR